MPSPHPEEQSGTVCLQPQTAGLWDGVTEHPSFRTPNTSRIRKLSLNHTSPPPSSAGHNLSLGHSHIRIPLWCDPCTSRRSGLAAPKGNWCLRPDSLACSLPPPLTSSPLTQAPHLLLEHPTTPLGSLPQPLHPAHTTPASYIPHTTSAQHHKEPPARCRKRYNISLALAPPPKGTPLLPSS